MRLLLLTLALSACSEWQATPEAGFRRMAAHRLTTCIQSTGCIGDYVRACFEASRQFCLDAGYPKECGYGEPEASCR